MHLIWAGLLLGIAAVWGVPIVSSLLKQILPQSVQAYLPTAEVPGVTVQGAVSALVYGVFLVLILMLLSRMGLSARVGRERV